VLGKAGETVSADGDRLNGREPKIDFTDPASLEAFYSGFQASFCEHWRKVVLANCKELVRARFVVANEKISEARIDDLSRLHDHYLDYLIKHLEGKTEREVSIRQQMGV
jgi:hypothetical protein